MPFSLSTTTLLTTLLTLLHSPLITPEPNFDVNIYSGPKECPPADKITEGKYISIHYIGTIDPESDRGEHGLQFDSTWERNEAFDFKVGDRTVIQGWEEGVIGLCRGVKVIMVIPPYLAYGAYGAGVDIPPGATLRFDMEIVTVSDEKPKEEGNVFREIDVDGDGRLGAEEVMMYFVGQGIPREEVDTNEIMASEDKDKDGFISWEEFEGPKGERSPLVKDDEL